MEGVIAHYSPLEQRLDLEVPTALLAPQLLGNDPVDETPPSSATGLVFDYALHLQSDRTTLQQAATRQHAPAIRETSALSPLAEDSDYASAYEEKNKTAALSTELRLFSPRGLLVNRGYTTLDSGESSYVREDSFWTYSELDSMRTWVVGDFIGSSLTWTRSLRFGGAQLSRNFGVRPDLVTFALPALGGTALVPTTVDLYVNGNRQFSGDARPGPFLLTDPPPLTGAGNVAIVYRDELGRQVTTTQPLYVDTRLLESGFSDYNIDVGYPRRHYGTESSDYGSRPEASASLRYGVTDALTLEGHTELSDTLQNAGAGLLLRLGQLGVLSGAAARSRGVHVGTLTSVGYQYIAPIWSIDLYDRRTHSDYGDLGTLEGVPVPQRLTRGSASVWFTSTQALSLNYVDQRTSDLEASRVLSLSYSGNWFNGRVSTYLSVFRDQDNPDEEGGYLSVNISFGQGASAYSSASRNADERTLMFGASRPLDYDLGGFGWSLASERGNDDYRRGNAQLDYRHRYVDLTAMVTQTGGGEAGQEREQWSTSLDALGSLVFMHRSLFATRAIEDGFALVSTRGLPDVPVLRENRALGRTNKRGFLLVPDLPAYRASRIGIDLLDAPVDVSTSSDLQFANPRGFSGVVVEFPIERMRGATLVLVDADEQPLPPGLAVTLRDSGASGVTGYGGQVFFSSLEKINRVVVETEDGPCEAEVTFDETQVMQTLGPFVCKRADVP
jgi:outer membrane usher protein